MTSGYPPLVKIQRVRVVKIQRAPTGVDLYRIGRLLGHGHLSTTSRYLHLARSKLTGHPSPLELLAPLT